MRKLLVLAAFGIGLSVLGGQSMAKADWGPGPIDYGYGGCDHGYGGPLGPGGVYVERLYPLPIYEGRVYRRYSVYGGRFGYRRSRYGARYRGRYGYRERYRYRGRF